MKTESAYCSLSRIRRIAGITFVNEATATTAKTAARKIAISRRAVTVGNAFNCSLNRTTVAISGRETLGNSAVVPLYRLVSLRAIHGSADRAAGQRLLQFFGALSRNPCASQID